MLFGCFDATVTSVAWCTNTKRATRYPAVQKNTIPALISNNTLQMTVFSSEPCLTTCDKEAMCVCARQHSAFTTTRHFLFQLLALLVKPQMLVLPNAHGLLTKQTQGVKYDIIFLPSPTVRVTEAHCCNATEIKIDQYQVFVIGQRNNNTVLR